MLLIMTPQRGVDELPHPLCGNRFVQESIDNACGDETGERALMGVPTRDDQHEFGELRAQAGGVGFATLHNGLLGVAQQLVQSGVGFGGRNRCGRGSGVSGRTPRAAGKVHACRNDHCHDRSGA